MLTPSTDHHVIVKELLVLSVHACLSPIKTKCDHHGNTPAMNSKNTLK